MIVSVLASLAGAGIKSWRNQVASEVGGNSAGFAAEAGMSARLSGEIGAVAISSVSVWAEVSKIVGSACPGGFDPMSGLAVIAVASRGARRSTASDCEVSPFDAIDGVSRIALVSDAVTRGSTARFGDGVCRVFSTALMSPAAARGKAFRATTTDSSFNG